MSTRPILIALAAFTLAASAGCGGPTRGMQARERAEERLDMVNSKLSYDQGEQKFEAGQFEKALKEIDLAIKLYPNAPKYYLLQGRIYLETHRLEKALESFGKAAEIDPEFPDAHYYMGIVHQRWSDDAKAYDEYMEAYEIDPSSVPYLLAAAESMVALEQYSAARRLIESKLTMFEHNAALRHLLGQIAMLEGDTAKAAELLSDARRLNPEDEALLDELAQAQYSAGLYKECLRSVKALQDLSDTRRPELVLFEARCLAFMERLPEARNLYLELTRLEPTEVEVWIELGTVAWELDDFHRTALCGARVTALAPDRYEGYLLKGINERHHGNLQEAILYLTQAADRSGEIVLPHLVLGRTLEETGDHQAALETYGRALSIDPENADAEALFTALMEEDEVLTAQHPDEMRNE